MRGQYGRLAGRHQGAGYREEAAVDPQSETETFVAAKFVIDDWRWSGVPVYVRTGKRLPKRATEIAIQFREVPHRLFASSGNEPDPNLLAIRIQPDEGIMLRFGAKIPGLGLDVRSVTMDFSYGSAFSVDSPDAYETLILDALQVTPRCSRAPTRSSTRGDRGPDHRVVDDRRWAPNYEAGTWGPPEADDLLAREGRNGAGSDHHSPVELRWTSKADSIVGIEQELARIWSQVGLTLAARTTAPGMSRPARA